MPEWVDSPSEAVTIIAIVSAVFGALFWLIDVRVGKILHEVTPDRRAHV
jgi:hypothetical protein